MKTYKVLDTPYRVLDLCANQYTLYDFAKAKREYNVQGIMYKYWGGSQDKRSWGTPGFKGAKPVIQEAGLGLGVYTYCAFHLKKNSYTIDYYSRDKINEKTYEVDNTKMTAYMGKFKTYEGVTARAVQEIVSVIDALKKYDPDIKVVAMDVEIGGGRNDAGDGEEFAPDLKGISDSQLKAAMTNAINECVAILEYNGYTPVLYASRYPIYADWFNAEKLNCPRWVASQMTENNSDVLSTYPSGSTANLWPEMNADINAGKTFLWQYLGDCSFKAGVTSLNTANFHSKIKKTKSSSDYDTSAVDMNWCYLDLFGVGSGGTPQLASQSSPYTGTPVQHVDTKCVWFTKPVLYRTPFEANSIYTSGCPCAMDDRDWYRVPSYASSIGGASLNYIPIYGYVTSFYITPDSTDPIVKYCFITRPQPTEFVMVNNSSTTKNIIDSIISSFSSMPDHPSDSFDISTQFSTFINQADPQMNSNTSIFGVTQLTAYKRKNTSTEIPVYVGGGMDGQISNIQANTIYVISRFNNGDGEWSYTLLPYGDNDGTDIVQPNVFLISSELLSKAYTKCDTFHPTYVFDYYPHEPHGKMKHIYYVDNNHPSNFDSTLSAADLTEYQTDFEDWGLITGTYVICKTLSKVISGKTYKYYCIQNPLHPGNKSVSKITADTPKPLSNGYARYIWIRDDHAYNFDRSIYESSSEVLFNGEVLPQESGFYFRQSYPGKQSAFGGTYKEGDVLSAYQYSLDGKYIRITESTVAETDAHWMTAFSTAISSVNKYGLGDLNLEEYLAKLSPEYSELKSLATTVSLLKQAFANISNPNILVPGQDGDITSLDAYKALENSNISEESLINACKVFGAHPQYTPYADIHIGEYDVGRMFYQSHVFEQCIVSVHPGEVEYLPFLSSSDKDTFTNILSEAASKNETPDLATLRDTLNGRNGNFFKFKSAYSQYMNHVNLICRAMAIYLGLGEKMAMHTNTPYKYYDWGDYNNSNTTNIGSSDDHNNGSFTERVVENIIGTSQYVHFSAVSQPSESISTSTRSSAVESLLNGSIGDTIKDFSFVANGLVGSDLSAGMLEDLTRTMGELGSGTILQGLAEKGSAYLQGGKIIFPQMIDDVAYDKSFNCTCKFISPSGDPESIYLRTLVPLAHLLAFCLPKQMDNDLYTYPFLVKASCKGVFSTELGIISNLSITRGGSDETSWTYQGLPSELEVSFTITPLYSKLMQSSSKNPIQFMSNAGLHEYLATLCGVDVKKESIDLQLNTVSALFLGGIADIPTNIYRSIFDSKIVNNIRDLIKIV